jgi:hypothetical protein
VRRRWLGHVWNPHSLPSSTRKYPAEPSSQVREARAREWHIFAAVRSSQDLGRRLRSTRRVHGTALETTIDKFGPKPPAPPRRRPLSSRTRPRRGRANSTSHDRPLTANAPFPVHHPPTARRTLPHLRPRGHLRTSHEPVHADPLSARTPTASTPTPHASLRHQLTANGHDRHD